MALIFLNYLHEEMQLILWKDWYWKVASVVGDMLENTPLKLFPFVLERKHYSWREQL